MKRLNQILNVDDNSNNKKGRKRKEKAPKMPKERNNAPLEITTIARFFAIAILVFGICMIGTGSYSMYKGGNGTTNNKPIIYVEQTAEEEILLKVTHDKELTSVTYDWNEEGETNVPTTGKKEIETTIQIPSGTNTLKVHAKDVKGQEIEYTKVCTVETDININIEPESANLKITANGVNKLQYMTYRWDEEDETRIDIEGNQIEETIEIPKGLHKLTVIVVDINNKTETKEQEVQGVTKPKVEVTTDGSANFIIKASDDQGIKTVEFTINKGKKYKLDLQKQLPLEQRKEFEYAYPLQEGKNRIEVTVYNENDVTETVKARVSK